MAGTAACGSLTPTNTRRVVIERMAIGAIVRRVDTGLGDDNCLGRGDALLRIEARSWEAQKNPDEMTRRNLSAAHALPFERGGSHWIAR